MGLIFESDSLEALLALILIIFTSFYLYVTQNYSYWEDKGVRYSKPCFPFGSSKDLFLGKKDMGEYYDQFYKEFENEPYFGIFEGRRQVFVVKHPDLVKRVLTKDFNHFYDRFTFVPINLKEDYLDNNLFNMVGKEWRTMRVKLSPTFTSGKMKAMFLLMKKCKDQLMEFVESETKTNPVIDVKDIFSRFTMDIIATCAFGLETNTLSEKKSEFHTIGCKMMEPPTGFRRLKIMLYMTFPFLNNFYKASFGLKDVTEFITKVVQDTVEFRINNEVRRNDFLDLLIKIRQNQSLLDEDEQITAGTVLEDTKPSDRSGLTIEEMAAQVFIFFAAGFETSSSTTTFCLYELARHPEVQDRLCQEVRQVLANHVELSYQALQEMTYMEQVINETLRRYASLPLLMRTCTEDYQVPDSSLVLKKGQQIIIPTYSLHHDPLHYPQPFNFDPDRFAADQVKKRHPYVHLPFGEGPRMCIGNRFGLLQTKLGLADIVLNFEIKLSSEMEVPIRISKSSFLTMPENRILLHLTRRE